jgi:hypothetical protein
MISYAVARLSNGGRTHLIGDSADGAWTSQKRMVNADLAGNGIVQPWLVLSVNRRT